MVNEFQNLSYETEWLEFKQNNSKPEDIGEYISALANSSALIGKPKAYLIWGIENNTHKIIGTNFKPNSIKIGNEELENWLLRQLSPKINFRFHTLDIDELKVILLEIESAFRHPVRFKDNEYIRIGSYKKKLKEHPEKERELWRVFDHIPFEKEIAVENVSAEEVLRLLNYPDYFNLTHLPLPENRTGILEAFKSEGMITESSSGRWNITNFGAVLFAKKLSEFSHLKRKAIRFIQYRDDSKFKTIREVISDQGYATGYESLIKTIMQLVPSEEVIEHAFRKEITMFPELAIRELVANAMIHQDFHIRGTSIMVELFANRIEITNPGLPLVATDRFLGGRPKSRNEAIAAFMRRINICEERGSGIAKVVMQTEFHKLPAPLFRTVDEHTQAILFAQKAIKEMDKSERIRACYLHASLRYFQHNLMTNTTLRERFNIDIKNSAIVSRIIADTIKAKLIRCQDDTVGSKARKYIPFWV
jgi:predicted HTH transcriptional regulator